MKHIAPSCLAILFVFGFEYASAQPSFDCAKGTSEVERLICADEALAILDLRLSETYKSAVAAAKGLDSDPDEALSNLRATQRGWIKGRDACWKAQDLRGCVEASYLLREGALVAFWMLQKPGTVMTYICEDNPANEVTVYFFDTELPSVRLEYGDGIKTGALVSSASGARYSIDFGGLFWTKADSAQFSWNEGETMSCTATN